MNEKVWYQIIFKQMSPIHIGEKNYGVLSETRVFIPGWTMWGALVNRYGQFKGGRTEDFEEGKRIFENITCFYPQIADEPMFPNFKEGRLFLGNISEKQFRINFTDVFVSTAIDPKYRSAKDASLHETEIILHKSKDTMENLFWVGLVGVNAEDSSKFHEFMNALHEIFVGGEIAYGFGKMIKHKLPIQISEDDLKNWNLMNDGTLYVKERNTNPMRNYISWSDFLKPIISKLEFIVQYDFTNCLPNIVDADYCFVPGSEIGLHQNCPFKLKKGKFIMIS